MDASLQEVVSLAQAVSSLPLALAHQIFSFLAASIFLVPCLYLARRYAGVFLLAFAFVAWYLFKTPLAAGNAATVFPL